jgi:glycosyltransferase involved in cell wall biosynthesis/predicted O-methyltransferase YrrM
LTSVSTDPVAVWPLRDYVSPGLRIVRLDSSFPHMRPADVRNHPWKFLRRDVPHLWYADERFPLMGFLNRDEATLLHNIALQFAGRRALEIGSWLGWSTAHLALAGVVLDVIDPAHDDPIVRSSVEDSLAHCKASANLIGGRSPESIAALDRKWSLFFIDGDHEAPAPVRDTLACLPYATADCAFVFHDVAAPAVADAVHALRERGFNVLLYQTAQMMALAWRGNVTPVAHVPDPDVAWQIPMHLEGLPISGFDEVRGKSSYRRLRDVAYDGLMSRPSVCIVTGELIGPFKNGGVGTAMTGLAETLASHGLQVTVLYTGAIHSPDVSLGAWKKRYAAKGIELDAIAFDDLATVAGPLKEHHFGTPWLVHQFLERRHFDVIHFNDCCGDGSLALAAKKLGIAYQESLFVLALHSPSRWVLELNQMLPASIVFAAFDYAEHLSTACADVVWSPSGYLFDWVGERGFELPEQAFVQQYAIPSMPEATGEGACPSQDIKEIVFFGRLEERKGLRLFCNAIDVLPPSDLTITFLGKPETCAGMPSLDYIARRAKSWTFRVKTITDLGQPEALGYLRSGGKLAVMASPFDNSPCTVYEALGCGIPFLAARTGGIPELIHADDRDNVLFDPSTEGLNVALRTAVERGAPIARPAISQEETRRTWIDMHEHWQSFLRPGTQPDRPLTVAAIIDHIAGAAAGRTIDSLLACPSVKRFVIFNRNDETLSNPNIDLMDGDIDAIEKALQDIAEDVVMLIHSGVTVIPDELETMLRAFDGVDGLQPAARKNGRLVPPLGGSAVFSLYEGSTFTGALAVRREALNAARANHSFAFDAPFLGLADYVVARKTRIWPYPRAVIEQSDECTFVAKSASPQRIAAYDDASPNNRYYMLASAYDAAARERTVGYKRKLAFAAIDLGLSRPVRLGARILRVLRRWMR